MTLRMYANLKKIPLQDVTVELKHDRQHSADCADCEDQTSKIEVLQKYVTLEGELSEQQRQRLLQIADRCPVHQTLHGNLEIQTELIK